MKALNSAKSPREGTPSTEENFYRVIASLSLTQRTYLHAQRAVIKMKISNCVAYFFFLFWFLKDVFGANSKHVKLLKIRV